MKFGITQAFPCNYLPDREERLLVCVEPNPSLRIAFSALTESGFRRSGDQIYRPHCTACNECQSVRVLARAFKASKSQKRVLSRNKDIEVRVSHENKDDYYTLYERYISEVHADGSMFPASPEQYFGFVNCEWQAPIFLEARLAGELIGVAVTDKLERGYSALYTFFSPSLAKRSLGTFFILKQIALAVEADLPYLYLGYQVDGCQKMNYKQNFLPQERFFEDKWHLLLKKP
ncbi:arginyltransferase [Alteromonas sp. W364]|uniref:arginyltransferase n=1 Tax=Alteromonas sp. W364 TaxID=3075610 RepID=UPI002883DA60|nr:arginyltransferase [Alteromonas sp. W364]MDT0628484.1 arginyltransferase [Alteromonas sp. W364]